jgi:hypothetical protein
MASVEQKLVRDTLCLVVELGYEVRVAAAALLFFIFKLINMKIFDSIPLSSPKRSVQDLTHGHVFSTQMGNLVPQCVIDCVPGDKFHIGSESMVRFAPMIAPPFNRYNSYNEYFFVPRRILWNNFQKWQVGQKKVDDTLYKYPSLIIQSNGDNYTRLLNHLKIPHPNTINTKARSVEINMFAIASYWMIWDEYYRDQNLQKSVLQTLFEFDGRETYLTDGNQDGAWDYVRERFDEVFKRSWSHDYFTSCLPFAQKGDPVNLPLGQLNDVPVNVNLATGDDNTWLAGRDPNVPPGVQDFIAVTQDDDTDSGVDDSYLYAQTSQLDIGSTTIKDLRRAYALQRYLERLAIGGTRMIEWVRSVFGVKSSDKRFQRPELIVRTKSPVVISEVLNTSGTDTAPQGNMSGHGLGLSAGSWGSIFIEEPGYILGLTSVLPETYYYQGVPRHYLKFEPEDHFLPQFEHIGEQAVVQDEIYAFQDSGDTTEFGFLPRYSEYKFENNAVTGDFQSSLLFWTEARKFDDSPVLDGAFVKSDPSGRVFAVEEETDQIWFNVVNHIKAVRPMSKYSSPI